MSIDDTNQLSTWEVEDANLQESHTRAMCARTHDHESALLLLCLLMDWESDFHGLCLIDCESAFHGLCRIDCESAFLLLCLIDCESALLLLCLIDCESAFLLLCLIDCESAFLGPCLLIVHHDRHRQACA